jgi:hypothetical protein
MSNQKEAPKRAELATMSQLVIAMNKDGRRVAAVL